jgi:hypothetical protein
VWAFSHDGPSSGNDNVEAIAIDGDDNVIAVGYVEHAVGDAAIWVRKLDADGNELWTAEHQGDADLMDVATGVDTFADGRIAVVGYVDDSDAVTTADMWIRLYAP